jgi:O-antigen/teichoic acid export membrane protein
LFIKNPEFAQATILLQVSALTLTTYPFVKVLGYTLVANKFEKFNLIEVTVTTILGSIAGIFLISQYKLVGAAIMMLVTALSAFSLNYYIVYTRLFSLKLFRIFRRPLLVSGLMALVFFLLKQGQVNFIWTAIIATFAYVIFTGILTIQTLGGFSVVWQKMLKFPRTIFGNK